jgi:hypothetical protein
MQPAVEIAGEKGGLISSRRQRRAATLADLSAGDDAGAEPLEPDSHAGIGGRRRRDDYQRVRR